MGYQRFRIIAVFQSVFAASVIAPRAPRLAAVSAPGATGLVVVVADLFEGWVCPVDMGQANTATTTKSSFDISNSHGNNKIVPDVGRRLGSAEPHRGNESSGMQTQRAESFRPPRSTSPKESASPNPSSPPRPLRTHRQVERPKEKSVTAGLNVRLNLGGILERTLWAHTYDAVAPLCAASHSRAFVGPQAPSNFCLHFLRRVPISHRRRISDRRAQARAAGFDVITSYLFLLFCINRNRHEPVLAH